MKFHTPLSTLSTVLKTNGDHLQVVVSNNQAKASLDNVRMKKLESGCR